MTKPSRALIFLLHAAFFLTGISTVLIGQVLPVLSNRLALDDAEAGQFFVAQFAGSFSGVFLYNFIIKKFGFVSATLIGMLAVTIGCLSLNSDSWSVCAAGFFLNGIGIGTTLPSINMLIAEFNPLRTASALNLLNFFWGVGAICSQPFVAALSSETSILLPTAILSAMFFIAAVSLFFAAPKFAGGFSSSADGEEIVSVPIWKNPVAWLIAFFNFLHVGMESGVGGWLTTYSARFPQAAEYFVSATPVFFVMFVVGRGFAPLFLRFLNENRFLLASLATLSAGIVMTIFAESYLFLLVGAGVMGFGTSGIFPTNMARFTKIFGDGATRNATPIFVMGSLGGAYTTWFIGYVSNYFENLRAGIFVLLASSLILIVLQIIIEKAPRPALR